MQNHIENALNDIFQYISDADSSVSITRTINTDPENYEKAYELAEVEYERIRNDPSDVNKISCNLSKEEHIVLRVKNYIFFDEHTIVYQDNSTRYCRLDADPEMVNAWDRLAADTFIESDLAFFAHEEYESSIAKTNMLTYNDAHKATIEAGFIWEIKED